MDKSNPVKPSRVHDYKYDPVYQVSSQKDFIKEAYRASMDSAQVGIAPNFKNMFSELPNHSRNSVLLRNTMEIETSELWEQKQKAIFSKNLNNYCIVGSERSKFFKMPVVSLSPELIGTTNKKELKKSKTRFVKISQEVQVKGTQTMYRESSAQTKPWQTPYYKIMDDGDPEVLKLNFLRDHLPAGVHEVELILQARRRRAWEKLIPGIAGAESSIKRRQILEAIEVDQWVLREQEISDIQQLRLNLLEKMLQEYLESSLNRTEQKLNRIAQRLQGEREKQLKNIKLRKERELRRLYRFCYNIKTKYHKVNVIEEHIDYKSELYGPLMRYGENPKRGHMIINQYYKPVMYNIEEFSTLPRWLFKPKIIDENKIKLPGRRLCIRETKWTEPVLKELHEELSELRKSTVVKCRLRKRIVKEEALDDTMRVSVVPDTELEEYEAAVILQSIIRGRATQTLIYEGRDRCRELIQELQSTHALVMAQEDEIRKKRMKVLGQQRAYEVRKMQEGNIEEMLHKIQGSIVGTMLDYLNKELVRVMDERKAHALALLYERERRDKEAAEGGRRQFEERRRKEHDEIFKQVVKVHQDTVDLYLRDIIIEGMDNVSHANAKEYVEKLTEQIKEDEINEPTEFLEKEQLIADMICHFVIPEVEKQKIRERITGNQRKHINFAHEYIYNKIEKLPKSTNNECDNEYVHINSDKSELPSLPENVSEVERLPYNSKLTELIDRGVQVPESSKKYAAIINIDICNFM